MKREELFDSDFGIGGYEGQNALVPVSRKAFEEMLDKAAAVAGLEVDDMVRQAVVSYLHHLPNDHHEINMNTIASVIRNSYSRHLTYMEGAFAKQRMEEAGRKAIEDAKLKLVRDDEPKQEGV